MTYKARLEQLLSVSVEKSRAFLEVVSREGQSNSPEFYRAKEEWEQVEEDYLSLLQAVNSGLVRPEDPMLLDHASM